MNRANAIRDPDFPWFDVQVKTKTDEDMLQNEAVISGLDGNTDYLFQIVAVNSAGDSDPSDFAVRRIKCK